MLERQLCVAHVCATVLWCAALSLAILAIFIPLRVGALGVVLGAAAGTLNIKHLIESRSEREIEAFNLGRDAGRLHSL